MYLVVEALAETADSARLREEIERQVRYANIAIIEGIGASQCGIGMVCAAITGMVLRDARRVIPLGTYLPRFGVTLSLPAVVGRHGVTQTLTPAMSAEETHALDRSAEAIREALRRLTLGSPLPKAA